MQADSGTPTQWLADLSDQAVHVHCACDPKIAARRFFERRRHPGHLDGSKTYAEILAGIQALASLEPLEIGPKVSVDMSEAVRLDEVVREIRRAFAHCARYGRC